VSELSWIEAAPQHLDRTVELLRTCFPAAHKFDRAFLQWCYYDNPAGPAVGWNVEDQGRLVGHLVGQPQTVRLRGEAVPVVLLVNVATHPDYRGRGLFLEIVRRTLALAAKRGFVAVTGVANQQTYRAYEKHLGFQNVAGLDAHVEVWPEAVDMPRAVETAEWSRVWDDRTLAWRLGNPDNPLRIAAATPGALIVEGASSMPPIRARGQIPRAGLSAGSARAQVFGPAVVLGLTPAGCSRRRLAMTVPNRLRPSPLVMIYQNLKVPGDRLDPNRVLFSFLDFDAF
jgi:GNAT superfamily N-acetyltransferase